MPDFPRGEWKKGQPEPDVTKLTARPVQSGSSCYLDEDTFERLAASVIAQLKGAGKECAKTELEIFSLRKMDKARTKVVYYRNVTVTSLEQASTAWHAGCQNIPELAALDWSKDKSEKTKKWVCSLLNHAPQVVVVHQSKFYGEQGRNLQPVPSTDRTITLGSSSYVD